MIALLKRAYQKLVKNYFIRINPRPIIVVGHPKSGTSAIAGLLSEYGNLTHTIDIPPLWGDNDFEAVKDGHKSLSDVVNRNRVYFSTQLIKEPNLVFILDDVVKVFPESKYVFIVRDPRDTIRSLLNRINVPGHLQEISESHLPENRHWRSIFKNRNETGETNYISLLAEKWNEAVDNYLKWKDRMIAIRYEDFNSNKIESINMLAGELDIPQKSSINDRVDIQYQPRGNREISWHDFFGKRNLRLIEKHCEQGMNIFGYRQQS